MSSLELLNETFTNMKLARALRFDKSNFSMEPKDLELPVHDIAVEATWEASENLPNRLNWLLILASQPEKQSGLITTVTSQAKPMSEPHPTRKEFEGTLTICLTSATCMNLHSYLDMDRFLWRGVTRAEETEISDTPRRMDIKAKMITATCFPNKWLWLQARQRLSIIFANT
ncbi:hypothetical protein Ac2012v2_006816 [Leucoagaricus gongylophorus]